VGYIGPLKNSSADDIYSSMLYSYCTDSNCVGGSSPDSRRVDYAARGPPVRWRGKDIVSSIARLSHDPLGSFASRR
jgi:hypothetical protein